MGDLRHQRGGFGDLLVQPLQACELRANLGHALTRLAFAATQLLEGASRGLDGEFRLVLLLTSRPEKVLHLLRAVATADQRLVDILDVLLDLLQARGVHGILELGVGERFAHLGQLQRGAVNGALGVALLAIELGDKIVQLDAAVVQLACRRSELVHILLG